MSDASVGRSTWDALVVVGGILLVHGKALVVRAVNLDEDCSAFDALPIGHVR